MTLFIKQANQTRVTASPGPGVLPHGLGVVLLLCLAVGLTGCAVLAVADAAVTVGATVVKAGAAVAGAAVDVTSAGVRAATGGATKE